MIHSGSRGFGHQVATDALLEMEKAMKRDDIVVNDRQLACARINSPEGQNYLKAMAAAANFAWVNRSSMTFLTRQAFAKQFQTTPDDLDMHVIYDVSHNIAKEEIHIVDGKPKRLLVHRKGATRAFPPHHPMIPVDYQLTGQPVLVGGTMGTCSYVLTGTDTGFKNTFGSTCHGAVRKIFKFSMFCSLFKLFHSLIRVVLYLGQSPAETWTTRTCWTSWNRWAFQFESPPQNWSWKRRPSLTKT